MDGVHTLQLKDKEAEVKSLNVKFDKLNKEYDQAKGNQQKLDQLQQQYQDLQKQKEDLEKQLQAKKDQQSTVALKSTGGVAYAASLPNDDAKAFIYSHESGNNPGSVNASSGACGLGQALPCSKMPCGSSDYACQDTFFTNYMLQRYGSWAAAQAFWVVHHWW